MSKIIDYSSIQNFFGSFFEISIVSLTLKVIAVVVGLIFVVKKYLKYSRDKRRSKYPKDVVILHQVPRGLRCPRLVFGAKKDFISNF